MTPSGSELLLSAPRSHGLPINNHQYRMHNRAISSHHSRLNGNINNNNNSQIGNNNRRRRSVVATATDDRIDHDDTAPLLLQNGEGNQLLQQQQQHQPRQLMHEKDANELSSGSFKNLKDQQSTNNSRSNNNSDNTSPSSSSGRMFFPHWRSSFFSRNFRFARQSGCKLTRSVTLLMTKPEKLEFLANTQSQFPDDFGYYGDSDEGSRLLQEDCWCSATSPPPPPFLTPTPEEEQEGCSSNSIDDNGDTGQLHRHHPKQHSVSNKPLICRHHHHHRNQRSTSIGDEDGDSLSNCLAPSYSQALLLMEPNERDSVMSAYYFKNHNPSSSTSNRDNTNNQLPTSLSFVDQLPTSSTSSSLPQYSLHAEPLSTVNNSNCFPGPSLDSNLPNEQRDDAMIGFTGSTSGSSNNESGSKSNPSGTSVMAVDPLASRGSVIFPESSTAHSLRLGRRSSQNNCPSGTTSETPGDGSLSGN